MSNTPLINGPASKGNLKITQDHYDKLYSALSEISDIVSNHAEKQKLKPAVFAWNMLRAANIDDSDGITWICDNLYSYMHDGHITSALLRICKS